MRRLFDCSAWRGRFLLFGCLLLLPFLRFLMHNRYDLLSLESGAAVSTLIAVSAALAALTAVPWLFPAVVIACSVYLATLPVIRLAEPFVRLNTGVTAGLLAAAMAALAWVLRKNAAVLLAVFTISAFGVDVVQSLARAIRPIAAAVSEPQGDARRLRHVLYIVLDEQMAPAALPASIPECRAARSAMESMFARFGFKIFGRAYSNYPSTLSSLPSLLNRTLLTRRRMFMDETAPEWQWGVHSIRRNLLFEHYARRGYRINLYQHRAINLASSGPALHRLREYSDSLGNLDQVSGAWSLKMRYIVGNYQQADEVLGRVKAFFPFRFAPHTIGPLGLHGLWPQLLLSDLAGARENTLFFAHLMAPHFPYLYRRDGSLRPLEEWHGDRVDQRSSPAVYVDRYRRYCGQVEFLSGQMAEVFTRARRLGLFDSALVAVHGDHGSRIRMQLPEDLAGKQLLPASSDPELFDYRGKTPARDLADRFAVLLAVKQPGQTRVEEDTRPGSALRFLSEAVPLDGQPAVTGAEDTAFLFDLESRPKAVPAQPSWE